MTTHHKAADPHFHGARTNRDYSDALSSPSVMLPPAQARRVNVNVGVARMLAAARGHDELSAPRIAIGSGPARRVVAARGIAAPSDPLAVAHVSGRLAKRAEDAPSDEGEDDDEDEDDDVPTEPAPKNGGGEDDDDEDDEDDEEKQKADDAKVKRAVRSALADSRDRTKTASERAAAGARLRLAMRGEV